MRRNRTPERERRTFPIEIHGLNGGFGWHNRAKGNVLRALNVFLKQWFMGGIITFRIRLNGPNVRDSSVNR